MKPEPRRPTSSRHAALFVALAYLFSWACWGPLVLADGASAWWHYAGGLGPLAAAVVVTASRDGRTGLVDLGRSMVRWRAPWTYLAVGLPLGLFAIGATVAAVVGDPLALGMFLGSDELPRVGAAVVALEVVCFGFGEETGWRGFLLPALEEGGRTPYRAASLVAAVWAGWHLPLFFYGPSLGGMEPAMIAGWLVSLALASYFAAWLYHRSGNSVLVLALFHGTVDLVAISPAATGQTLLVLNAGLILAAVLVLTRSRLLFETAGDQSGRLIVSYAPR